MLLFFAIALLIIAAVVFVLTNVAAGMSDNPTATLPQWPAAVVAALGIICLVLHFVLKSHVVHW